MNNSLNDSLNNNNHVLLLFIEFLIFSHTMRLMSFILLYFQPY